MDQSKSQKLLLGYCLLHACVAMAAIPARSMDSVRSGHFTVFCLLRFLWGWKETQKGMAVQSVVGDKMDSLAGVFHEIETSSTSLRDSSSNLMVNNHVI